MEEKPTNGYKRIGWFRVWIWIGSRDFHKFLYIYIGGRHYGCGLTLPWFRNAEIRRVL